MSIDFNHYFRIFILHILYTLSHHFRIIPLSHFIHVYFRTFAFYNFPRQGLHVVVRNTVIFERKNNLKCTYKQYVVLDTLNIYCHSLWSIGREGGVHVNMAVGKVDYVSSQLLVQHVQFGQTYPSTARHNSGLKSCHSRLFWSNLPSLWRHETILEKKSIKIFWTSVTYFCYVIQDSPCTRAAEQTWVVLVDEPTGRQKQTFRGCWRHWNCEKMAGSDSAVQVHIWILPSPSEQVTFRYFHCAEKWSYSTIPWVMSMQCNVWWIR